MEIKLKKNFDPQLFLLPVVLVMVIFNASNNPSMATYLPYIIGIFVLLFGYRMYRLIWFPAAKIVGEELVIYDNGSPIKIKKDKIKSFSYTEISKSKHEIVIKQDGFEPWVITIDDKHNHIKEGRLYKFINDNFWQIIPYK